MKIYRLLIPILTFLSCQSNTDKLFWIDENTGYKNDFLFLAESTNILPISADSMKMFLNQDEIAETRSESQTYTNDTILTPPVIYKNFGEIYKTSVFKVYILFRNGNDTTGLDYKFIVRTYSPDWKIIDSYDLAIWNKRENKYCFGSINKKLIIEKYCRDSNHTDIAHITKSGEISKPENI